MTRCIQSVAVLGLGRVGELVALVLAESGFDVTGYDAAPRDGVPARPLDVDDHAALAVALAEVDAVISCLPFHRNTAVAEAAAAGGTHYFDLTEDLPTTNRVIELAASHDGVAFAPQCGLAPGLIGIIGASMAAGAEQLRSIELKVGALPRFPTGRLGYAFNWSPEGVVNEYLNDCEVVRGGRRQLVPALTGNERVIIGGIELEAALTSGGLGTMCRTYEGRLQRLDYKTLRYPGHFDQMRFLFEELGLGDQRDLAGRLLRNALPAVDEDVVYLHAAVESIRDGFPYREEFVRAYRPLEIGGRTWRAISWTTACSAVAVMELVADGVIPANGFVGQEDISLADFTATSAGRRFLETGVV